MELYMIIINVFISIITYKLYVQMFCKFHLELQKLNYLNQKEKNCKPVLKNNHYQEPISVLKKVLRNKYTF